jgi:hypothetical protein
MRRASSPSSSPESTPDRHPSQQTASNSPSPTPSAQRGYRPRVMSESNCAAPEENLHRRTRRPPSVRRVRAADPPGQGRPAGRPRARGAEQAGPSRRRTRTPAADAQGAINRLARDYLAGNPNLAERPIRVSKNPATIASGRPVAAHHCPGASAYRNTPPPPACSPRDGARGIRWSPRRRKVRRFGASTARDCRSTRSSRSSRARMGARRPARSGSAVPGAPAARALAESDPLEPSRHRRERHPEQLGDLGRRHAQPAQHSNSLHPPGGSAAWNTVRRRRAILQRLAGRSPAHPLTRGRHARRRPRPPTSATKPPQSHAPRSAPCYSDRSWRYGGASSGVSLGLGLRHRQPPRRPG